MCFWVAGCGGWRVVITLAFLAGHPIGRGIASTLCCVARLFRMGSSSRCLSISQLPRAPGIPNRASLWFITVYANASSQQHIQRYDSLNKLSLLDDTPVAPFPDTHTQVLVHKGHKHLTYPHGHLHTHRRDVFFMSVNERKQSQPLAPQETAADCWMIPSAPKPE